MQRWIDEAIGAADRHDRLVLVTEDTRTGPTIVGFIAIGVQSHYIHGTDASIGELAVAGNHEGRGIGRALIGAAASWAHERGRERLTLQTGAADAGARGSTPNSVSSRRTSRSPATSADRRRWIASRRWTSAT